MKTAATVLQEMMVKMSMIPEYECIAQSGPQHQSTFAYRCTACGVSVTASAHSKKEAKQEAAKLMLWELSKKGYSVPPPYGTAAPPATSTAKSLPSAPESVPKIDIRSYVALLKEFCEEYKLPACDYDVVETSGPPHLRQFTVQASVGRHSRRATATTKKAARQIAAEQLYVYLRENLAKHTDDFQEEEALVRAHEKAMSRFVERRDPQSPREDLGQKVSEYHLGLCKNIDEAKVAELADVLSSLKTNDDEAEDVLTRAAEALGLGVTLSQLGPLHVVQLSPSTPDLVFADSTKAQAMLQALHYVRLAFDF